MLKTTDKKETPIKSSGDFFSRNKLVGGYVPPTLADKFSLYAIYKGLSRSIIIHELVANEIKEGPSEAEMIDAIALRLLVYKPDTVTISTYKTQVMEILRRKKLSEQQSIMIVNQMEAIANGES